MAYTNSPLVDYTRISPNKTSPRNHTIDTIAIHCVVGQCSVETLGRIFAPTSKQASCNYGIGYDGKVGMYVEECDRSWCTSSREVDNRAITIEVASDNYDPYAVKDVVYEKLIVLVADICKRNGIKKLVWSTNKNERMNRLNGCNMMVHRDYANKSCVPVDTEVLTREGWVKISDINIGDYIACADLDNLNISFEEVYDKVEIKEQDTYTNNGLTATSDHRMVYGLNKNKTSKLCIDNYINLLNSGNNIYIPLAGNINNSKGLDLSDAMIKFLVAVQADGYYMWDNRNIQHEKQYYGVEFHLSKQRKIDRLCSILDELCLPYNLRTTAENTTKIDIYNYDNINIVKDICENQYLENKTFTWKWLNMNQEQADLFISELLLWDGCVTAGVNGSYCSRNHQNLDVVSAVAVTHGYGSYKSCDTVNFYENPYITLSHNNKQRNIKGKNKRETTVTCVSVKTGIFVCRQHGKTFIIGNCPGDYLYNRHFDIAERVNKILGAEPTPTPTPTPSTKFSKGDIVKVVGNAYYYNSTSKVPNWVKNEEWYLADVSKTTDRCVLGKSTDGKYNIMSPISDNYLELVKSANPTPTPTPTPPSTGFKKGDKVKVAEGAYYYNGKAKVPDWVIAEEWYLAEVNATSDRCVLGKSTDNKYNIMSPISSKYLTLSGIVTTPTVTMPKYTIYVVKYGDTLGKIAVKYNTTYQKIAEYNGIKNPNIISVGQKIKIPL